MPWRIHLSSTDGGEVGIPLSMSQGHYQKALAAADSIINSGMYSLYRKNPHLGENFYEATVRKDGNSELIFAKDYDYAKGKSHNFTQQNIPFGLKEDVGSSSSNVTPVLNLVENYDYLDGSDGSSNSQGQHNL